MLIKVIYILLISITVSLPVFAGESDIFYTIDEYFEKHPNQAQISNEFDNIVRSNPIPLKYKNKKIKIAMVYPAHQASDYWKRSVLSFRKRLEELKIDNEIITYFSKPSGESRLQAKQIKDALGKKVDYLVVSIDNSLIEKIIGRILVENSTKIIVQNMTTPLKKWEHSQPFLYVGFDHIKGSKLLADYYTAKFPGKKKFAILYGTKGLVSKLRGKGFLDEIKNTKFELVSSYYTDFNKDKALNAALEILSNNDPDFIFSCSTDIALGVSDAIDKSGKIGKVITNGWGGGESEIQAILQKKLEATVMRMNDDNGIAMAEAIKLDILGNSNKVPTMHSGEFKLLTSDMPVKDIIKYREWAFRYSGL